MRIIIVGCGGMGSYQAKKFQQLGATIVGAIDHNRANLSAFCSLYSVPWSSESLADLALMQGKADAVTCALPDSLHLACCVSALSLGFSLFAEKPMGLHLLDAKRILEASDSVSLPVMVNYSKRNMQALQALRTVILDDTLGTLLSVTIQYNQGWILTNAWGDWRTDPRWKWRLVPTFGNGGCISDLTSHLVDALFFLFHSVSFVGTDSVVTLEDLVLDGTVQLEDALRETFLFDGSVPVSYEGSFKVGAGVPCSLSCTQISKTDIDAFTITVTGSKGKATLNSVHSRHSVKIVMDTGSYIIEGPTSVPSTYQSFMNWVDRDIPGRPSLYDGLLVQEILEEMKQWR